MNIFRPIYLRKTKSKRYLAITFVTCAFPLVMFQNCSPSNLTKKENPAVTLMNVPLACMNQETGKISSSGELLISSSDIISCTVSSKFTKNTDELIDLANSLISKDAVFHNKAADGQCDNSTLRKAIKKEQIKKLRLIQATKSTGDHAPEFSHILSSKITTDQHSTEINYYLEINLLSGAKCFSSKPVSETIRLINPDKSEAVSQ